MRTKKLLSFKKDVNINVLEWIEKQGNANEAITYLIEKEIFENGMRDLVLYIPIKRTDEYFESMLNKPPAQIKDDGQGEIKEEPQIKEQKKHNIIDEYTD